MAKIPVHTILNKDNNTTGVYFENYSEPRFQTVGTPGISGNQSYSAAGSVGGYGLFPRGDTGVMCFDDKFVETIAAALSRADKNRNDFAAATVGAYCLFAGGNHSTSDGMNTLYLTIVDAYDTNLVRTSAQFLGTTRSSLVGVSSKNYALFGGGIGSNIGESHSAAVDAYDAKLVWTTPTPLSAKRARLAATMAGDYYLFGGGAYGNTGLDAVDAYSATLTHTTPTVLSRARYELKGASVGSFGLFAGGGNGADYGFSDVDAYDAQLTRTTATGLYGAGKSANEVAGATIPGGALFACGASSSSVYVSAYDAHLTRFGTTTYPPSGFLIVGTRVGDCGAFAAANNHKLMLAGIRSIVSVKVPPWWVYQFTGDTEEKRSGNDQTPLTFTGPFSGYMKPADITLSGEH